MRENRAVAISRAELCARWAARLVFLAAALVFVNAAISQVALPPMHPAHEYSFFDLKLYRHAAGVVSSARPLYSVKLRRGLGFTYPPFSVLLFLPLTWLRMRQAELVVTLMNVALIAVAVHAALALGRRLVSNGRGDRDDNRGREGGSRPLRVNSLTRRLRTAGSLTPWLGTAGSIVRWLATAGSAWGWLAAAAALWFEPVTSAIGYGQIDLLIAALAIADLAYGRRSRAGGIGIGLAAAIKLTPLVFIPYLALTGRGRMAARALAAFALSIVVALMVLPSDSLKYWGGKFFDVSRVAGHAHDPGAGVADQSLRGGLLRLLPGIQHTGPVWMPAALLVGVVGLTLAVRAARRGDEVWGYLLAAITGLLISPVSWTHHWAIVVPGVLALVVSNRRRPVALLLSAAVAFLFADEGYKLWPLIMHKPPLVHFSGSGQLLANLYVLGGLGAIGLAAALDLQRTLARRRLEARRQVVPILPAQAATWDPALPQPRFATPDPGHSGARLRAMTTSQQVATDRQSS
jgi:alpha-1,2-mannosyltransferase